MAALLSGSTGGPRSLGPQGPIRRWVDDLINRATSTSPNEFSAPRLAASARQWVTSFRASFPDVRVQVVTIVAEGDQVVGRFTRSATHTAT